MLYCVRNLPVKSLAQVHVRVPDGTKEEDIEPLIRAALKKGEYKTKDTYGAQPETELLDSGYELDYAKVRVG